MAQEFELLKASAITQIQEDLESAVAADADRAEVARDIAEGFASDIVSQGNVPIYSSVETVQGLPIPDGITAFRVNGYTAPGDGGAGLIVEGQSTDPGAFQDGGGKWWVPALELVDKSVGQFGDDVASAVEWATARDRKVLQVDDEIEPTGEVYQRSNVVFRGIGRFEGANEDTGIYRRQVIHPLAPSPQPVRDLNLGLVTSTVGKSSLNVVITGSSGATFLQDAYSTSDVVAERIRAELMRWNPDRTINFFGRGVGGATWAELDSTPPSSRVPDATQYPWYTDGNKPWLDYIEDLDPDIVIIALGSNDRENMDVPAMYSVVDKIKAMPSSPDIIFLTQAVPNMAPHPNFSGHATYDALEGRDFSAGFMRTYAWRYGIPLLDINRTANMMRDGRDVVGCYFPSGDQEVFGSPTYYQATVPSREWSATMTVTPDAFPSSGAFRIGLSEYDTQNRLLIRGDGPGGKIRLTTVGTSGQGSDFNFVTEWDVPTENVEITVEKVAGFIRFRLGGRSPSNQPVTIPAVYGGGLHRPYFRYEGGGDFDGPITRMRFRAGVERQFMPTITDWDMWGVPSASSGSRPGTGGNGINHLTTYGNAMIYNTHFGQQDWRLP